MDVELMPDGVGLTEADQDGSDVVSLSSLVQLMLDRPLNGREPPIAHVRQVEAQKMFASRLFEEVLLQLSQGRQVRIKGFGKFGLFKMPESTRSPRSGKVVQVTMPNRLRFYPSAKSVQYLNSKKEGA